MAFEEDKVPLEHADLFHHGDDGRGLSDAEWDAQKEAMRAEGTYPLDEKKEE